jgi:hypothetical protein
MLYFYCQTGGTESNPSLRFGTPGKPYALDRNDLSGNPITGQPLVFANACSTAAADPYVASLLEATFFARGCRAYLGTETKVPVTLASRVALAFFRYFYPEPGRAPISAGEAVAQTRLLLWTAYRNIGGLLYAYINNYEIFMADDAEVRAMQR